MEHKSNKLLEAVASISEKIGAQEAARETARQLIKVIGGSLCTLFKWDPDKQTMRMWAEFELEGDTKQSISNLSYPISDFPEAEKALATLEPIQVQLEDTLINKNKRIDLIKKHNAKFLLIQPLFVQDRLIGFAELFCTSDSREFNKEELESIKTLGYHASLALDRAILLEETNQRAAELEAVRQASLSLTSSLELDDVLHAVLENALRLSLDAMDAHVFLYNDDTLTFGEGLWQDGRRGESFAEPRQSGITYSVARSGNMLVVPDMSTHPIYVNTNWKGAIIGIPLKNRDNVVGVMNIAFENPRTFTESNLRVLQLLADHAGIAIERATLVEETEKRVAELEAVRQASLSLTASLELDDVLHAVLENALHLSLDAMDAHIFLYKEDTLSFGAALWTGGRREEPYAEPRQSGSTYSVARSGETLIVSNMQKEPIFDGSNWGGAIIGMPLKSRDEVVGVMNIAFENPRTFTENDLRALHLLADQAAIAIINARLHDQVSQQALTDPLTNLPNRRAFDNRFDEEIRRSERYAHLFSLVVIDFDKFKRVNDSFGHLVGDQTLKSLADCMSKIVRDTDFLARIGGDEFALILPETNPKKAKRICEKLNKGVLAHPFGWKTELNAIDLSCSFGISCYPEDGKDANVLFEAADVLLYKKKKS